jgi:hypothetical protein
LGELEPGILTQLGIASPPPISTHLKKAKHCIVENSEMHLVMKAFFDLN